MKFSEYPYTRPDYEQIKAQFQELITNFKNAESSAVQIKCLDKINQIRCSVSTQQSLASIRYTINSKDEFYSKENDYWDENGPLYEELEADLSKTILSSKFINELKAHYPSQMFTLMEDGIKVFDQSIIQDLQEENRLTSKYSKIIATAQIEFEGKIYTLPQLGPLSQSPDRELRKRATDARIGYYKEHKAEIEEIYDQLVKLRDGMAKKLGFKNFVEMGYVRMDRSDYNAKDVAGYRQQILESVTPLASEIVEQQKKRLGYDELRYYDAGFKFNSGNPKPQGTPEWIIEQGKAMYSELSPETKEFFTFMTDHELMDLVSKDGKRGGGYCTYMPDFKSPFIFSNFNGTSGDIDVLTHEAGHAFQVYSSRWIQNPDLHWPTYESAEIHSMSMEFFTYPWMEKFFGPDTAKYYYSHLAGTISFLPYGVLVDHFQHEVYEHPEMTPAERNATWRRLEKMYMPFKNYEGADFFEEGCWWMQQQHIFNSPFYYIDYTLAQVCAQQFYVKSLQDRTSAWKDYLHLCQQGGTKSFLGLVKEANLENPFAEGTISKTMKTIKEQLEKFSQAHME